MFRNVCVIPVEILAREEQDRTPQGLNALRVYDFLKQAGHPPEVASIRLNARLNHPLSAEILAREEQDRAPQGLNALRVYDFLKQAGHHPEVASIRLNARLNHPLSADHIEMQLVACLVCEGIDKKSLCSAIPFTEGMERIDLREQASGFARKLD